MCQLCFYTVYFWTSFSSLFGYFLILQMPVIFHLYLSFFVCSCVLCVALRFPLFLPSLFLDKVLLDCAKNPTSFSFLFPLTSEKVCCLFLCAFLFIHPFLCCAGWQQSHCEAVSLLHVVGPRGPYLSHHAAGLPAQSAELQPREHSTYTMSLQVCTVFFCHQAGLYSVASGWSVLCLVRLVCILLCQVRLYSLTSG